MSEEIVTNAMVRFQQVWKKFGDLVVLRNLNLNVRTGEKVAIIGVSGSGKSTLLRVLMTLDRPSAGRIEVDGDVMWDIAAEASEEKFSVDDENLRKVRRKIGMVFQSFNLFPHMTVLRNITEALIHVKGLPKTEAEAQTLELLDRVGLRDKARAYPAQLSGGQQQRVAIARALAMDPKVMLFDEVTSSLDPELVGEVLMVIRELAEQTSMTMLIVTHEMGFARDVSDRVLFLHDGTILEEGPAKEMLSNPKETRTRQFLRRIIEGR